MKALIVASTLLASVALAGAPSFAAAALCALPAAAALPVSDQHAVPTPPVAPVPPHSTALPAGLAGVPFAEHVAAAGATLTELGQVHGMRMVSASNQGKSVVFTITPDGQAAVEGLVVELTAAQLGTLAGSDSTRLTPSHGLEGMFVRLGGSFQVFYTTPDKERVIAGVLWDATGKDITREQVAGIPGAIPTVEVGAVADDRPPVAAPVAQPAAALPLLGHASGGTVGAATAPHLYMFIDPQCVYSVRAMQALNRFVTGGRLQLSVIPLSVLDYEDHGVSTKAALALLSKPVDKMVAAWQAGDVAGPVDAEAQARLQANMAISDAIKLKGTPTFIWRKVDGTEDRLDGIPTSYDALVAQVGS